MDAAYHVESRAARKTGIPSWYMLVCVVLGVSNALFPWADTLAEHIDKASAATIVRMLQNQLSDEPRGPTAVAAAAVLAGNAHGLHLHRDAAVNKKQMPEQAHDGQKKRDTSIPTPVNLFGPFGQLNAVTDGMNYLTGTVDKVESFFITYGAIMWKMLLLYAIFYVSGSWRLVVVSWLTINLLGTQLAASMGLACFMLVSTMLAEGPIATSIIGGLWLIHEAGCLDLSYWGKKGTSHLRRQMHMTGDGAFNLEDLRQLLHKPLLAASFLPLLLGSILFSSGLTPQVSATGDSRRDTVIGGYCLVMGLVYLVLSCIAEADGSLGHLSVTKLLVASLAPVLVGTYLVGNWLDSTAFVNGLEPAGNGTVADNNVIPFAPVFRVQSWNLYVGIAFILIGLATIIHAVLLKRYNRRVIDAEGAGEPLNRP